MMNKNENVLTTILSKGYSHHFSPEIQTGAHQSIYANDICDVILQYHHQETFIIKEEDYQQIIEDPKWLPDNIIQAFNNMTDRINECINSALTIASEEEFVYIVMAMYPPNYSMGKLITTIADPSNGAIITLEGDKDDENIIWKISCLWGIKLSDK